MSSLSKPSSRPDGALFSPNPGRRAAAQVASSLVILVVVALGCWWYLSSTPLQAQDALFFGGISSLRLGGFHSAETSDEGRGYRWTDGAGTVQIDAQADGPHVLAITMSAPPPAAATVPVKLTLNGAPLASVTVGRAPRRYRLLAHDVLRGANSLAIKSPKSRFTDNVHDRRQFGVIAFDLAWRATVFPGWMLPAQVLAIAVAVALLWLMLARAGIPLGPRLVALALFLAILISMRHSDTRFLYRWRALELTLVMAGLLGVGALIMRPQPGDGPLPWRAWAQQHWPALAGYLALTAVMFVPMLLSLNTAIPGYPGDASEYLWKTQLFSDYLIGRHQTPTFLPWLMYPEGFELANSEITPANTLIGLPLTWLFGSIVCYNLQLLASYVFSGFFAYLLAHRLGARRLAAWVGGIVFAFALSHAFHMLGHMTMMPTQYLALALYGLEGMVTRRRSWDAFVVAIGLALTTWASLYFGSTFIFFMGGYLLLRIGLRGLPDFLRQSWRSITLAGLILIAITAPFAQPYIELRQMSGSLQQPLIQLQVHAAHPSDYLLTNPFHPIWGAWARQFFRTDGGDHFVALGFSVIILTVIGLCFARPRRLALSLAALMAATFVLTLGPDTMLPGDIVLNLPVRLIHDYVPVLNGIRVWNRFAIYMLLCAAVLIGLAITRLRGQRYYLGAAVAALALVVELAVQLPSFVVSTPRAVDLWLREQPGHGAVIELPYTSSGAHLFNAYAVGKPSNMWYGTFDPPLYAENAPQIDTFPSAQSIAIFQRWKTEYVVINERKLSVARSDWAAAVARYPQLSPVYAQGGYSVYRVVTPTH